ncbi:MAG TPA: flagellar type III secretion system pore protein FliP [Oligoflexus sp.]|uniref:flagellar type III secretion system pore protein FliP n=1 Tax=Oligoflexus sp. TaxID=1971216 RepID=UPI002D502DAF|nr:flagellar type III secretion system pore protein FliP [Oligoflexus sp.]HYX39258.1 flagellar type III secretion system pore protein FliP [Oligoflexus sp.]
MASSLVKKGLVGAALALLIGSSQAYAETKIPGLNFNIYEVDDPDALVPALKIIALLTILGVAPAILLMMTSFTRIVVVLSFVRQALGTQTMPPNQVILGLSLFLTFFTMGPVIDVIQERALTPYLEKAITQEQAVNELMAPLRTFMLREVKESDLQAFFNIAKLPKPKSMDDVPMRVLIPSFVVSELKTAFQIGFLIYIPFLVIDMVVSSVLMGMGMMMLPPTVVSLPFKLVLFVLVDGWGLIVDSLVRSFSLS